MIALLLVAALSAPPCPVTAYIAVHSYTTTTTSACVVDFQYRSSGRVGALKLEVRGDGIFRGGFER